ncbi:hypothetical protein EFM54_03640 [Lentilactobacillus buchneri]|nr:hypothetical protein [Lentilactobacillus buchneri]
MWFMYTKGTRKNLSPFSISQILVKNRLIKTIDRMWCVVSLPPWNSKPIILTTDTNNQILGKAIRVINELQ